MENSLTSFWRNLRGWQRKTLLVIGLSLWAVAALLIAVQVESLLFVGLYAINALDGLSLNILTVIEGIVLYTIMFAVLVGVPWLGFRWRAGLKLLGIDRLPQWIDIGVALSGIVLYFVAASIVMWLIGEYFPQVNLEQSQDTGISTLFGLERLWVFLLFVVIGPFMEELIFRGYLQGVLRKNGVSFVLTTIIVSVLFGAAHGQWNVAINVGVLAVMMSIGREITGSIWPSILMHMMKNGLAYYLLFVMPTLPGIQ